MKILQRRKKNKKTLCSNHKAQRNNFNAYCFVILFVATAIFVFPEISAAYLDPGTGSFLFQMFIASIIGGLYTIKTYWRNIMNFFKKNKKE
jgi:hypothetical protein